MKVKNCNTVVLLGRQPSPLSALGRIVVGIDHDCCRGHPEPQPPWLNECCGFPDAALVCLQKAMPDSYELGRLSNIVTALEKDDSRESRDSRIPESVPHALIC